MCIFSLIVMVTIIPYSYGTIDEPYKLVSMCMFRLIFMLGLWFII